MTVQSETSLVNLEGNGTVGPFPCDFKIFDDEHIDVYVDGVLQPASTYTVSGVGDESFSVTFAVAPPNGSLVTVARVVPLLQLVDYLANDSFPAETHERALDLIVMGLQQIASGNTGRSIRLPPSDPATLNTVLVAAADRVNKLLGFDSDGAPVAVTGASLGAFSTGDAHNWTGVQSFIGQTLLRLEYSADETVAAEGPNIDLASVKNPAETNDRVGAIRWKAKNSDGAEVTLGRTYAQVADPTSGAEDVRIVHEIVVGGLGPEEVFRLGAGYRAVLRSATQTPTTISPHLILRRDITVPADGDLGGALDFEFDNDAGEQTNFAYISAIAVDVSDGSEDGRMVLVAKVNGSDVEVARVGSDGAGVGEWNLFEGDVVFLPTRTDYYGTVRIEAGSVVASTAAEAGGGRAFLGRHADSSTPVAQLFNDSGSFGGQILRLDAGRPNNSAYDFLRTVSDYDGSSGGPDLEHRLIGDGSIVTDGSVNGVGPGFAEWFEWADGNPRGDDRTGITVALEGGKIRMARHDDDPAKILGVVSDVAGFVGNAAELKWHDKWRRDHYGRVVRDGEGRRVLNPAFDRDAVYVPRSQRPEWAKVSMCGQEFVRKGQPVGDRWLRVARDLPGGVEKWVVR